MKSLLIFALLTVSALSWVELKDFSSNDVNGSIGAVAFLHDNSGFISGTTTGLLRSFSTSDPYSVISQRSVGSNAIKDIKVSPSGGNAVVCAGRSIHLISLPSLATTVNKTLPGTDTCNDVEWSSNGDRVYVVGTNSGVPLYTSYNATDLVEINGTDTDFKEGTGIQDSSLNGDHLVLAGEQKGNATSSNVLLYNLNSNDLEAQLPVSSTLESANKKVMFSPNGNQIVVVGRGTNSARVFTKNSNNQFVFTKDLTFGSNVVDSQFLSDGTFVILRQNGASALIQFISLGDSTANGIVVNSQINTGKGTPGFLAISPNSNFLVSSFGANGAKLYSSSRRSAIYPAVIGAVVGSVVVGSVVAVAIAGAVAPMAGSIGATGATQAGGIIGTQAVSSAPMNVPINVDNGGLQPDFKAVM